ncbi:MAG: hypothetical protein M3N34_10805 [Pseudomonadota bacterium]|nr:hypothetical protein [Pseudomonadota bacterium]
MKLTIFAAGLLSLAIAVPVSAQSVPDDMRCFVLSNLFAKAAKDPRGRTVAAENALFYLGRLDGKADPRAIAASLHSQIDPKTAGPLMTACAQRFGRVEQAIAALTTPAKH